MRAEFRPQFRVLGGKSKASLFMFEPFQENETKNKSLFSISVSQPAPSMILDRSNANQCLHWIITLNNMRRLLS